MNESTTNKCLTHSDTYFEVLSLSNQLNNTREREAMRVNKTLLQDAIKTSTTKADKDKRFEDVFKLFIRSEKARNADSSTIKNYEENIRAFRRFFDDWFATDIFLEKMCDIEEEHILNFIEYMRDKNNSDGTINARLRHLRAVFYYALNNRYIKEIKIKTFSVITKKADTKMEKEKETRLLSLDDMTKLLEIPETDDVNVYLDWITTITLTELGIRRSTLWNIQRDDIDLVNCKIHLRHLKYDNEEYKTKFLSEKYVECLLYFFNLFDSHIEAMKEAYVTTLKEKAKKLKIPFQDYLNAHIDDVNENMPGKFPLCMKNDGGRIAKSTINDRAKRYTSRVLGNKKANAHALRHSCGTNAAEQGASPFQIAQLLGHKDIASTMHYLHSTEESKKRSDLAFSPSALMGSRKKGSRG